jgi:hypothetical protein
VPTSWWAGGLRLAERLGGDVRADRTSARLAKWRAAHDTAEQFAARLDNSDLDETTLGALLAEPTQEPAARTERPTWAAFVARASTDAARAPFTGGTWSEAFAHVRRPLTVEAAAHDPRLDDAFTRHLDAKLVRIADRALVLELNLAGQRGELRGEAPADRFTDFVNTVRLNDFLDRRAAAHLAADRGEARGQPDHEDQPTRPGSAEHVRRRARVKPVARSGRMLGPRTSAPAPA